MGSVGWVAVGVTAWAVVSVPAALLVGALLEIGGRRPGSRRAAAWERYPAPCTARRVRAA